MQIINEFREKRESHVKLSTPKISKINQRYSKHSVNFRESNALKHNLEENDNYDQKYNNQVSPEDLDKVVLDDLKTHKFKEVVKYCLREELVNSFKMDDFFTKKDNKINFMFDNYYVPNIKNKLYMNNPNKVKII